MLILTLNVRDGGNKALPHLTRTWLQAEQPDLLTFQEVRATTVSRWRGELRARGYEVYDTFDPSYAAPAPQGDSLRQDGLLIASRWTLRPMDPTRLGIQWPERLLSVIVEHPEHAFELHTAHIPNGSVGYRHYVERGDGGARLEKKIDTLEAVSRALTENPTSPRILTGDFNEPLSESPTGNFRYWNEDPSCPRGLQAMFKQRWGKAGAAVFEGLPAQGVRDVYREHAGPGTDEFSWKPAGTSQARYRYDRIFASTHFAVDSAGYDQSFRTKPDSRSPSPSDHAAAWARLRRAV